MKKIIIFYFIFLSVLVHAQNFQNDTDFLKVKIIEFEKSGNINTEDYFITLNNLAYAYQQQGKYLEAEPLFLKVYEKNKSQSDTQPLHYAASCYNLAYLYYEQGKYTSTESFLLIFLNIYKKELGEFHIDNVNPLTILGEVYKNQGRYSESKYLFLKAIKINEKIKQDKPLNYAYSLSNLALLYQEQGKYNEAEDLFLKVIEITEKYSEKKPLNYATALNNLAFLYEEQDKYPDAELLDLKSLKITKEVLGEKHPSYLTTMNNLAVVYHNQKKYSESESLYLKIIDIRKEVLGEKHPDYASSLNNLATLYNDQGKFTEAKTLYLKSLEISKEILGEESSKYFKTLTSLALLYQDQGSYSEVETLLLNSLKIKKKILGVTHPGYISNLYYLAHCYRINGDDEKASLYFDLFTSANQKRIIDDIYSLTEKELINYIKFKKELIYSSLSFLKDFPNKYPEGNLLFFENELLIKNLSLHNQQRIKNSIQKSKNQSVKDKYEQFIINKREIIKLEALPLDKRPSNFAILNAVTKKIEKDLVRECSVFSSSKVNQSISSKQVKKKLKKGEVALDIVAFNYHRNTKTDSIYYGIFALKKGFKTPKFISLFEQKQLKSLLKRNKIQHDSVWINKQYMDKSIYDLFLKPLQEELKEITTIFLSPTGLGHQIDFAALATNENQTLGEKYKLHILSSPSELVDYKEANLDKKSNIEILLYGGIDYNKSTPKSNLMKEKELVNKIDEIVAVRTRSGISGFDYIDGTNKEVNQIQLKGKQNGFETTVFKESEATKESVLQLDGRISPYVLHIATHGFFFETPLKKEIANEIKSIEGKDKIYKASEDPMLRSGLVFAGANNYWNNTNDDITIDNGILTASEISNLDLSACQLVVLSACETGLGEVKGSEGVFGLQRAFKMAGVKNIIMSLWKVPDTQTAELFDIFYSECFAGKTIHEAFQSAQEKMKLKYSPYYWAGFVLLE